MSYPKAQILIPTDEIRFSGEPEKKILEGLLRNYPNIQSSPVVIDPYFLSIQLEVSTSSLRETLEKLSIQKKVLYLNSSKLSLRFLEIWDKKEIPKLWERFNAIEEEANKKRKEMLYFVGNSEHCRAQMLRYYFNQTKSKSCGICDVCKPYYKPIETNALLEVLKKEEKSLEELLLLFPNWNPKELALLLNHWHFENKIIKTEHNTYLCKL
ncbi:MAG: hypothetical protein C4K58_02685 [Flavobacteriaceae bacterium]|nr:MAG: hypothetical protein C4K58_02685 [Flavobacteriaceae bacterium]